VADRHVDALLIGGGIASAACAEELRSQGFDGSILLVGREPDPPYHRPPASKEYLQGRSTREEAHYHPASWYGEHDVELLVRTSVMKLDPDAREATLSTKEVVSFDRALLATGANVRRLPAEGSDLEGLHYLRALRNADAIRDDIADAERVVLVGGSYIGSEVAASLTMLGKTCTIVMQEPVVLSNGFGMTAGGFFQGVLEHHGVEVIGGDTVARFVGAGERISGVVLESGRELQADAVVLGVGAVPDTMLARSGGLQLGVRGGVACDAFLRTSAKDVWAAGDMCEYHSLVHGRPLRVEHWDVAIEHGKTAARNMAGEETPHETIPYFFSDLADWASLEYVGPAVDGWDREVVRGSLDGGEFTVWYLKDGRVAAALSVGRSDDLEHARRLMRERTDVSARDGELADLDSDLSAI
jgi:3-phenylpropionate/trans-cinnamate dioxygenase ferredoxin reductase component